MASKPKNFNLVNVIKEYYMMKGVLSNDDVQKILSGEVPSGGASSFRDLETLKVMKDYVDALGQMRISKRSISGKSYTTLDEFLSKLEKNYINVETAKASGREHYSENPFDNNFTTYVSTILAMDGAEEKIREALNFNIMLNEKVAALPVLLGGKKQSTFISLLAQYTQSYSNISNLQNEIAVLKEDSKGKDAQIKALQEKLDAEIQKANEFKTLAEKALAGTDAKDEEYKALATLLTQSLDNMSDLLLTEVKVEGMATRKHVSTEVDRAVSEVEENSYKMDRIETQIRSDVRIYPNCNIVLLNTGYVKKPLDLRDEILRAAVSIGLNEEDYAIVAYYNKLNTLNESRKQQESGGKRVVGGIFAGIALLGVGAAGGWIAHGLFNKAQTTSQNMTLDDSFEEYVQNENTQRDKFESEISDAVKNGTFYDLTNSEIPNFDNVDLENVDLNNPTVKDYNYFLALRNEFSKDDDLKTFKISSTSEIDRIYENAKLTVMTNYYETNYANLLGQVADMQSQIDSLTDQLNEANADKEALQNQIDELQSQIDDLQRLLDAAEQENSDLQKIVDQLQAQLDAANERAEQLENENSQLREENTTLIQQVNILTNEISDLLEEIKQLKTDKELLLSDVADLNAQVYRNQKLIAQLQEQLENGGGNTEEYAALQEQIASLEAELEEAQQEIAELVSTNEALKAELVTLTQQLTEVTSSRDQILATYNELLAQYHDLLNQGGGASSEEIEALRAELEALRAELTSAYSTIANYESKIVAIWNGLTGDSSTLDNATEDLEKLLTLFGIDYSDRGASSYSSSTEYEPGD